VLFGHNAYDLLAAFEIVRKVYFYFNVRLGVTVVSCKVGDKVRVKLFF